MRDYLLRQIRTSRDRLEARNLVREVLQAKILTALQRCGAMVPLAFHGGTALRFLFDLGRFSEDLDFALERPEKGGYDFRTYLRQIERDLVNEELTVEIKVNDEKVVHSAFVRVRGLLYDLDLSPHPEQVLAVKLEVDTRPPRGAGLATTVVRRHETLHLQHHDRPSLLAGKLHALLQRPYTKGRDVYDLVWYLSDRTWPAPNLDMLQSALEQTGWQRELPQEDNWREVVASHLEKLSWKRVQKDLEPFIGRKEDLAWASPDTVRRLLETAQ